MRLLKRNLTEFTYTALEGKTEILKDGKRTGRFELSYSEPVPYEGNISTPSGLAQQQLFGIDTRYSHVLLMEDPETDIRIDGLIQWKGKTYEIRAIRPSLNVLSIALMERLPGDV